MAIKMAAINAATREAVPDELFHCLSFVAVIKGFSRNKKFIKVNFGKEIKIVTQTNTRQTYTILIVGLMC